MTISDDRTPLSEQEGAQAEASNSAATNASPDDEGNDELICQILPEVMSELLLPDLFVSKHVDYVVRLVDALSQTTSYEGAVTEHLRMSGMYWSLTTVHLLSPRHAAQMLHTLNNEGASGSLIDWIWTCYDADTGSFGGNTGQDGHVLYTLSALQILLLSTETTIRRDDGTWHYGDARLQHHRSDIIKFIQGLQQPDGSFVGDASGEIDSRFTYCAFQCLVLLQALDASTIDIASAVQYIVSCRNASDGGFGSCVGAESHAGQVFCCVGALAMAQSLHLLSEDDHELLAWWLCERQVDSGGLNGRPEKQADVCYSWWILSSLSILGKVSWIHTDRLAHYILKCQDTVDGGIADRPEDMADVFHTFFGIAGLSLLGHLHRAQNRGERSCLFRCIDPIYALPTDLCQRLQFPGQVMLPNRKAEVDPRLIRYTIHYCDDTEKNVE
jgi:geranylgeranyl transferase type-2 subunit beta